MSAAANGVKPVSIEDVTGIFPSGDLAENLLDEARTIVGLLLEREDAGTALAMIERKLDALARVLEERRFDKPIPLVPTGKAPKKTTARRSRRKAA